MQIGAVGNNVVLATAQIRDVIFQENIETSTFIEELHNELINTLP